MIGSVQQNGSTVTVLQCVGPWHLGIEVSRTESITTDHLKQTPIVLSQFWQACSLRGSKEVPQNLYNGAYIPRLG